MYDPKGDDPVKLRRFALTLAAILFGYALVGAQVRSEFNILGVPLIVRRPQLLPWALSTVAIWAMFRFFYYAMILNVSPMRARRRLRKGGLPDGQTISAPPTDGGSAAVEAILRRYFPTPVGESGVTYTVTNDGERWRIMIDHVPVRNRVLGLLEAVDYTAPLWFTALAIASIPASVWYGY
jgi:hypothetical protein